MKLDVKTIGKVVGQVCELAVYGLFVAGSYKAADYMTSNSSNAIVGYDDAVSAIMKSNMYSHDKCEAAAALKQTGNSEFYKAIIHVAKSGMYSHDKVDMIKRLSGE